MDGEAPGYRKGQSTGFPEAGTCSQAAGVPEKEGMTSWGLRSWHHGSKLHKRDFPESPMVKNPCLHCRVCGLDPWLGNYNSICCVAKTKPQNCTRNRREDGGTFFSPHRTHGPQHSSSHSGLHRTHRPDISSSCIYLLFLTTVFSDLQLSLPEFFQTLEFFPNSHYWLAVKQSATCQSFFFFLCLSHIPQSSDIITDIRLTLSEYGLRYFSASLWRTRDRLARHREPWTWGHTGWSSNPNSTTYWWQSLDQCSNLWVSVVCLLSSYWALTEGPAPLCWRRQVRTKHEKTTRWL